MLNLKPNNLVSWMAVSSRKSPVSVSLVLGLQVPDVILGFMWVLVIQFRASCCAAGTLQPESFLTLQSHSNVSCRNYRKLTQREGTTTEPFLTVYVKLAIQLKELYC